MGVLVVVGSDEVGVDLEREDEACLCLEEEEDADDDIEPVDTEVADNISEMEPMRRAGEEELSLPIVLMDRDDNFESLREAKGAATEVEVFDDDDDGVFDFAFEV